MGSPAMNLIQATIERGGNGLRGARSRASAAADHAAAADGHRGAAAPCRASEVIFGIRPEALTDRDGADRNATATSRRSTAMIEVVEPAGSDTFAVTQLGGKEVVGAACAPTPTSQPGAATPLAFNLDKAVLFDPQSQQRMA